MTLRLASLVPKSINDCIVVDIQKAAQAADNLAVSADTDVGTFNKTTAKQTEKQVYDEDDDESVTVKAKKIPTLEYVGVEVPRFREMIKRADQSLNLRESPKSLTRTGIRDLVKEEYIKILDEQTRNAEKIEKKLYELRDDLIAELFKRTSTTKETVGRAPMFKSLQLSTVSTLLKIPVNELTLYFLNNVKGNNDHRLIEYHLGHVYFYGN